jgi:carboxypeptidase family protein
MRKFFVLALFAITLACSDRTEPQSGPSTIPPSSPSPAPTPTPPPSRVVLSGTVSAAANELPLPGVYVHVVEGVNAGRSTYSIDAGRYELANLEPGAFTVQFEGGEYVDVRRADEFRVDTTLNVQLEKKGFVLSGVITTQWGEAIHDAGVEAVHDDRVYGGGTSFLGGGRYRIPTLPATDYIVSTRKWGYLDQQRPLTLGGDTTLDFVLDRVRVSMFGAVREAAPCAGAIQDARVEIVSGPDAGVSALSTATGYQLKNGVRAINWGRFTIRASKTGYVPTELSIEVLPPGWSCDTLPRPPESPSCPPGQISASSDVRQDFVLQRTGSC